MISNDKNKEEEATSVSDQYQSDKKLSQNSFEKKWRKRFEGFAVNSEDDAAIAGWSSSGLKARLRRFIHLWKSAPSNDGLWLDIGCGAGTYSAFLVEQNKNVIGFDYSLPTLQKARKRGTGLVYWCAADVNKIPVKRDSVDGVICFGVTQALVSSETVVSELARVVRPGGQVWIDALNGWCLPHLWEALSRWTRGRPMHLRYESHHHIRQLMKSNGLENVELYWLPMFPSRYHRFQWIVETNIMQWFFCYIPLLGTLFSHAFIFRGERSLK